VVLGPIRIVDGSTDWAAWITAVSTVVLAVFAVGAIYGIIDARRTRHAQIIVDFSRRWDEADVNESFKVYRELGKDGVLDLARKMYPIPKGTPPTATSEEVDQFFRAAINANVIESAGVLRSSKAVSAKVLYKMWGGTITLGWEEWKPTAQHLRQFEGHTGAFRYFEELANKVEKYAKREKPVTTTEIPPAGEPAAEAEAGTSG
jgi:hypothetical protein